MPDILMYAYNPAFRKLKQESLQEFEASLDYIEALSQKKSKIKWSIILNDQTKCYMIVNFLAPHLL